MASLQTILDWQAAKPIDDAAWAEDVKLESLHLKYDDQLKEMLANHSAKLLKVQENLNKFNNWPEAVRYGLTQQFTSKFKDQGNPVEIEGKTLAQWITEEFNNQQLYYQWKEAKLVQSIKRIKKEIELRAAGKVTRKEIG